MKKLFAIVLVLAMALAIAVPALAAGWDAPTTPAKDIKAITVTIKGLEVKPQTSFLGSLYAELSVMTPIVKGTELHFFVDVTIPEAKNLDDKTVNLITKKYLAYELDVTNMTIDAATTYVDGKDPKDFTAATGFPTSTAFGAASIGKTYSFEYWATADSGEKAATATATIGFYNTWNGNEFGWDNDADGDNEYTVTHTDGKFEMTDGDYTMTFLTDDSAAGKGKIDQGLITFKDKGTGGKTWIVVNSQWDTFTFAEYNQNTNLLNKGDTGFDALKKAFDGFFSDLGFTYGGVKYMTEGNFETYFGTIADDDADLVYPAGYVTVTNPNVEPPQTGDATTVVGFVMIALALVAAAYVTVKKVNA